MRIKQILLGLILMSSFQALQAQLEKELLLTFKQGGTELDAATQHKLEKSLQAFDPNTPIQVMFYQRASILDNGQFSHGQADTKNQAVINFLKSKQVKIKHVRVQKVEEEGDDNPNSIAILLSGAADMPVIAYNESPKSSSNNAPILPKAEKPEPSAGEEFFPSEKEVVSFERAAELFLAPFRKDKKVRPMYH